MTAEADYGAERQGRKMGKGIKRSQETGGGLWPGRREEGKAGMKSAEWGRKKWAAAFAALLVLQVLVIIYFGGRKTGFHEDEYYSFYSTNRTAGLYEPDREWVERDSFRNEFVVLPGEQFRYGLVATVQSWDVHPPFYYFILHTACSFFPGVFSKWLGIGVNLAAFCLNFCLLSWLAYMVTGRNKRLAWMVAAVHGFHPVIISGVMFIRMYEWLTVFVLLCACLHVKAVLKREKPGFINFLLPLAAVNYLGFLTQYYYIIFLFFMAVGFCLWKLWFICAGSESSGCPHNSDDSRVGRELCRCGEKALVSGGKSGHAGRGIWWVPEKAALKRGFWECVKYGCVCGISLLLAVVSYPASLSHIFRGYRGTGAVSEFLDTGNTGERLKFFGGLLNDYLFDGYLWLWLALMAGMGIVLFVKGRKARTEAGAALSAGKEAEPAGVRRNGHSKEGFAAFLILFFAAAGYFFTVSKTALLLFETSNRYQLPIYGIVLLLAITALAGAWKRLADLYCEDNAAGRNRWLAAGSIVLLFLFFAGEVHEMISGKVIFLYEEDAENVKYARENAHRTVIVLYNDATPYHVWWRSQELMEYDRIYFASEGNKEPIADDIICDSDKLVVYAADYDTQEESLAMILESNPGLKGYRLVSRNGLWSIYEFE